jgi:hypothetical protein
MKNSICHVYLYLVLPIALVLSCTDWDDNLILPNRVNMFSPDTELYETLIKMTHDENDENLLNRIRCVQFVYPITMYKYGYNNQIVGEFVFYNNSEFYMFLINLNENQRISISYPIQGVYHDGTEVLLENNEDLIASVESCAKDEILSFCTSIFGSQQECFWTVPYMPFIQYEYAGGFFNSTISGSVLFNYHFNNFQGNWVFLYVGNDLFLNINLEGVSETAVFWNKNFKVEFLSGNRIVLVQGSQSIHLRKNCKVQDEYVIGEIGPLQGVIIYDKGFYSDGWRYIEMRSQNDSMAEWGCYGSVVPFANFESIGSGFYNSISITIYHDQLYNFYAAPESCSPMSNGTVATRIPYDQIPGNPFQWSLPSIDELNYIYEQIHSTGVQNLPLGVYWSSTQESNDEAKGIDFNNGNIQFIFKNTTNIKTRFIRYF